MIINKYTSIKSFSTIKESIHMISTLIYRLFLIKIEGIKRVQGRTKILWREVAPKSLQFPDPMQPQLGENIIDTNYPNS